VNEIQHSKSEEIAQSLEKLKPKTIGKGESKFISLNMFKSGQSIEEIANERGMVPGTIESHLCQFIESGQIKVSEIVIPEKLQNIRKVIESLQKEDISSSEVKEKLGEEFSYGEIKATLLDWKMLKDSSAR